MENKIKLTPDKEKLIEKTGIFYEKTGLNPASARILALLLISDNVELTFDQIRNTLLLSKSATSNGLNTLLNNKQIEYITKMGDRKRYFRSLVMSWKDKVKESLQGSIYLNLLLKEILESRTKDTLDFNQSLKEVIHFMDYMEVEMPKLIDSWEADHKK
jgi:DNA-binding transcriptional regulator GbsR (MarR family)